MPKIIKLQPLLVTTTHRGVFYGWGIPSLDATEILLEKAQMCVSWSADIRGVTGLAAVGPSVNCKVGLPVPSMIIRDITAIMVCSPEAVEKWESKPWK